MISTPGAPSAIKVGSAISVFASVGGDMRRLRSEVINAGKDLPGRRFERICAKPRWKCPGLSVGDQLLKDLKIRVAHNNLGAFR